MCGPHIHIRNPLIHKLCLNPQIQIQIPLTTNLGKDEYLVIKYKCDLFKIFYGWYVDIYRNSMISNMGENKLKYNNWNICYKVNYNNYNNWNSCYKVKYNN